MAGTIRDALLLLCVAVAAVSAFKLPALERKDKLQERRFMERHGHLKTTVRPPLVPVVESAAGADTGTERATESGAMASPEGSGGAEEIEGSAPAPAEQGPGQDQGQEPEPEPEPNQGQKPGPEPEQEPGSEPEPEQEQRQGQGQDTGSEPEEETPDETPDEPESDRGADEGVEGEAVPAGSSNRQMAPQTQQVDQPSVINPDQISNIGAEETTTSEPEVVTYQAVPDNAYAVFDKHGRICILATINADLEIIYYTEYDERKKVTVRLPNDAEVSGACARDNAEPQISLTWDNFQFSMFFKENDIGNTWFVNDMKLEYDVDEFPEAKTMPGRQSLWMDRQMLHTLHLFGTPVDRAYFCTSKQDLDLYNGDGVRSATVVLWDLHLQPYVQNGIFGASVNCPGVPVGRRRINETVPMAVGSTLATVTILTIAGYAVWRHFKVKKFNYDTME